MWVVERLRSHCRNDTPAPWEIMARGTQEMCEHNARQYSVLLAASGDQFRAVETADNVVRHNTSDVLWVAGRGYKAPMYTITKQATDISIRVDDDLDAELWFQVVISEELLVHLIKLMGYAVLSAETAEQEKKRTEENRK